MAFADPQSITIDGTANSLSRVYKLADTGSFEGVDNAIELTIRPTTTKAGRDHKYLSMDLHKVAIDPVTGVNAKIGARVSVIVDSPVAGYTEDELVKAVSGLLAWFTTGSSANLKKFVAGEN